MPYTREELDRIENEWARKLYGRPAFLSQDDYRQLTAWGDAGVLADDIIEAINAYFERRASKSTKHGFTALSYINNDVIRIVKLNSKINLVDNLNESAVWNKVKEPLRSDQRCRLLFKTWREIKSTALSPDKQGFLTYFDAEHRAFKELVTYAESHLGGQAELLKNDLKLRLSESNLVEDTIAWNRVWEHHWMRLVCDFWGIHWQM